MSYDTLDMDAFVEKYREWSDASTEELLDQIRTVVAKYQPKGFFMGECQQFDSSRAGERHILPFGGKATHTGIPSQPYSPRGLVSDMSVVIAATEDLDGLKTEDA